MGLVNEYLNLVESFFVYDGFMVVHALDPLILRDNHFMLVLKGPVSRHSRIEMSDIEDIENRIKL